MHQAQHKTDFVASLKDEQAAVNAFIELLKKEENALIKVNMEDVDFLASDKVRMIEVLTNFSKQRCRHLISQGLPPDSTGMDAWLAKQTSHDDVNAIWTELLQLAQTAQQLNNTNGTIISTRLQHTQRAYAALQSAAGNISLYGPKGQAFGIDHGSISPAGV
tara:strand:- start:916 stop:1401 length:486 start_codon:yes stop_codon:yes gene_type:complete